MSHTLHEGDCLAILPTLPDRSVDCVVTDPPYPCIDRDYGRWTVEEWFALMDAVVPQVRRVLKPKGSAVFVLQPNSERVGRMRTWLWEFLVKWGREWGVVQDAYWWNVSAIPEAHAIQGSLMRPSLKHAVWLGPADCYRDQDSCLWTQSEANKSRAATARANNEKRCVHPSGQGGNRARSDETANRRGGVTPFNVLPIGSDSRWNEGVEGHGATTPLELMRWWIRYLCPPGGAVLDPFGGSGTCAIAAACEGRDSVLVERVPEYCAIIRRRLADVQGPLFATAPVAPTPTPEPSLFPLDVEDATPS